jgi:hypothetical protein
MSSRRFFAAALVVVPMVGAPAALARPTSSSLTRPHVHAVVASAEHSRALWATVNICNTPRNRNKIGIRGQMLALGFPAVMSIVIQVNYWSAQEKRFKPDPGVSRVFNLGRVAHGASQVGWKVPFAPHAGLLSGSVTFEWAVAGKLVGRVTRNTSGGHRQVDYSDPSRYSAASCRIS